MDPAARRTRQHRQFQTVRKVRLFYPISNRTCDDKPCFSPYQYFAQSLSQTSVIYFLPLLGASHGWLYHHGIVTPVAEDIAKRIMGEAPQFLNNLSIRDRWE